MEPIVLNAGEGETLELAGNTLVFKAEASTTREGGDEHELGPGSFALVPRGTEHTFSNPRPEPARFLSLHTPGGFEQYFKDVAAALGAGPLDPQAMGEIASRYDFEPV